MITRPADKVDSQSSTHSEYNNNLMFSNQTINIWLSLIFPKLEVVGEVDSDKSLRHIWRMAGTCKRARNIALRYIIQGNFYNKDSLRYWENSHHQTIVEVSSHGLRCNQLFFEIKSHADNLEISIHGARYLFAFFTVAGLVTMKISSDNLTKGNMILDMLRTYDNSAKFTLLFGIITCLTSILIVGMNHASWVKNRKEDKQILDYSRKKWDRLRTKRLALFNENKPESFIQRFQNSCNIL